MSYPLLMFAFRFIDSFRQVSTDNVQSKAMRRTSLPIIIAQIATAMDRYDRYKPAERQSELGR